jgi:hypothetical protein
MLRWVLLCDYCSFYHHFPKTFEFGRATTAHIIVVVHFHNHYHWFRVCSFAKLSSAFIISALEGAAVIYINTSHISSLGLHYTSMGHARLVCTHLYIISHLGGQSDLQVPLFSKRIALYGLTLALLYNTVLSQRNIDEFRLYILLLTSSIRGHLLSLKFRLHRETRTPHHQHRKTVIHGTRINSTAQKKGQNYTKLAKKFKSASRPWQTRACAPYLRTSGAYARLWGAKPARLPNGAFMKLVGLPTTNGSAPKSI